MGEPRRAGLMQLLMSSTGCQFVIPVYQRNYTWRADQEVKQFLADLTHVLKGDYKNHFLGILIYLEKSIDFSTREFSIIDGQQRLTTTFLTIYAVKDMFEKAGDVEKVNQLEGQYLTNPFHKDKIKYKLKPLVADDNVYRCIVENRMADIENPNSTVLKNYRYIKARLSDLVATGYSANDILLALDKLYVVCVPISEEDNAQKIFESINATGVKLTAADLIRNFLLMNLNSDTQDKYYEQYWKKIEDSVSSDSKTLEMFFRMYLAIKTYTIVPKNGVYRYFVDWVEQIGIQIGDLFNDLLEYAKVFNQIQNSDLSSTEKALRASLTDYRKINSDIPLSCTLVFYKLYLENRISAGTVGQLIDTINAFMIRRSICDMDSQNISKLFPSTLKKVLEKCAGNYDEIVSVFNQELVGNNATTSGSYMPTDTQMYDYLLTANVYKRPALRIILDRLELNDNPAPVDLSTLSIEHLMPQTPTEEWLAELDTDEETYFSYLHRLGNLTLAAKADNSKMSNSLWEYKNIVLNKTAHLKMNMELIPIGKWTLERINSRTKDLILRICKAYPYPIVTIASNNSGEIVAEKTARKHAISCLPSDTIEVIKNSVYKSADNKLGYVLSISRMYPAGDFEVYWFGYRESRYDSISECPKKNTIFICRGQKSQILQFPKSFFDEYKERLNYTADDNGEILHYHVKIFKSKDSKYKLLLTKPTQSWVDVTNFVIDEA